MIQTRAGRFFSALGILSASFIASTPVYSQNNVLQEGEYRGVMDVIRFDVSMPLRDIPPIRMTDAPAGWGGLIADPNGYDGPLRLGPQSKDPVMQSNAPQGTIPAPTIAFDTLPNQLGFSPPDPVGDIGPNHYVTMSNVHFIIHDRMGNIEFGPATNKYEICFCERHRLPPQ